MVKILIITIIHLLSFCSCSQEENKKITTDQNYQRASQDTIRIRKCWINLDYFEYINKSFPKKCEIDIDNPVLFLDSLKYAWTKCLKEYWGFDFLSKVKGDAFKTKYETELKRIYDSIDTVLLTYNPYWHIHYLKNENDCKNMYIVEYDNDSISVYDFPNKCETLKKGWDKDKKLFTKWKCIIF
jgi:hypothetical protein